MFALLLRQLNKGQTLLAVVLALVLIEGLEKPTNHLAHWRARIDAQVEGSEVAAAAVELLPQLNRVHYVATQLCQPIDNNNVSSRTAASSSFSARLWVQVPNTFS